ncbi:MAG TPA: hypothetical protein PK597_06310 [Oscillospiraceae bacterium]|nr:hypothetical protein [Oscillospiraceae bacterium]
MRKLTRREARVAAWQLMTANLRSVLFVSILVVALSTLLSYLFYGYDTGTLLQMTRAAEDTAAEGFQIFSDGFQAVLRLDFIGVVLRIALTEREALITALTQVVYVLVFSPIMLWALQSFFGIMEGSRPRLGALGPWYLDLGQAARAIGAQGLLMLVTWAYQIVVTALPLAALWWLNGQRESGMAESVAASFLWLVLILYVVLYCFAKARMLTYNAISYVLARQTELDFREAVSQGRALMRGRVKDFFFLRLAFWPLEIASSLLYGIPSVFVIPLVEITSLIYLFGIVVPTPPDAAPDEEERKKEP